MKNLAILNSILTFGIFSEIFKSIDQSINPEGYGNAGLSLTDVHYYFGDNDGMSIKDVNWGNFKMKVTLDQVEHLKKEFPVFCPLGEATNTHDKTEYTVVVLGLTGWLNQNYSILFQQKRSSGSMASTPRLFNSGVKEMTNVILLFPMNESMSSNGIKVVQTQYDFEYVMYRKDGEIYISYYSFEKVIDDIRD